MSDEIQRAHAELDGDAEVLRRGGGESRLQIAAMDHPIRRAVALLRVGKRHADDFRPLAALSTRTAVGETACGRKRSARPRSIRMRAALGES